MSQVKKYNKNIEEINDICSNRHKNHPFSRRANLSVVSIKAAVREKVYQYIVSKGDIGATCEEIEVALGLSHQSASARCAELKYPSDNGDPLVRESGSRPTKSGRRAAVLVAKEFKQEVLL